MIAQKSALNLEHFAVLQSHFNFNQPKRAPKDNLKLLQSYPIDIDFAHHFEEDGAIRVFVKIGVNQDKNTLPGYILLVEGVGFFRLTNGEIPEAEQNNLKFYSTVSVIIGYLRNSLSSMTSSAPMGPYLLPAIDLNDLFLKKSEGEQKEEK